MYHLAKKKNSVAFVVAVIFDTIDIHYMSFIYESKLWLFSLMEALNVCSVVEVRCGFWHTRKQSIVVEAVEVGCDFWHKGQQWIVVQLWEWGASLYTHHNHHRLFSYGGFPIMEFCQASWHKWQPSQDVNEYYLWIFANVIDLEMFSFRS